MKSSQKFHNYDRKGLGCQYKNPFLSRINRQKMFLDKAFFTLNFKWKALKITLKIVTVSAGALGFVEALAKESIIVWTLKTKSLLPSLCKREEFPLFGKEGLGEIFTKICLFN